MPREYEATCLDCSERFLRRSGRQQRCSPCQEAHAKAVRNSPESTVSRRTHTAVKRAIAAGLLERRPCEAINYRERVCGRTPTHGHHEDYARPLDVVWLCGYHHKSRHAELKQNPVPPLVIDRPGLPQPDRDW